MSILLLTMGPNLSITAELPQARVGEPAEAVFRAVGAVGLVTWRLVSSALPAEWTTVLDIDGSTASLSTGEALRQGAWPVTIFAADASRNPVVRTFDVLILPELPTGWLNLVDPWYVTPGDAVELNLKELW